MIDMNSVFKAVYKYFKRGYTFENNFIDSINNDIKKHNDQRLKLKVIDTGYTDFIFSYANKYYVYDSFSKVFWKCNKGYYKHYNDRKLIYKIGVN